jgi:6-phosphofructokinase 2
MDGGTGDERVLTVTLNPAIDVSLRVGRLVPVRKMRADQVRRTPGGGGVNVARALARLGAPVTALVGTGGTQGDRLCRMLAGEGVDCRTAPVAGETRESINVIEAASGLEYRFVLPGPAWTEGDAAAVEAQAVSAATGATVVLSGSLPPGLSPGFYGRLSRALRGKARRIVLDASGEALRLGVAGVDLVKPSLEELTDLAGEPLATLADRRDACRALVSRRSVGAVALSMGAQGAMLVTADKALLAPALPLPSAGAVGAGDTFLAALVWAQEQGMPPAQALACAIAGPAAALLDRAGTPDANRAALMALAATVAVEPL